MIPKGSDPNGTIFEKEYHWGLTPLASFCWPLLTFEYLLVAEVGVILRAKLARYDITRT